MDPRIEWSTGLPMQRQLASPPPARPALDLERFLSIVLRWSWLIVLCAIGTAGTAFMVSRSLPSTYEAEAQVLVGSLTDRDLQQQLAYEQLAQTYASLATTTPVLERVAAGLGLDPGAADLAPRITVRAPPELSLVQIVAAAATPADAAGLANAVAAEVIGFARTVPDGPSLAQLVQPAAPPVSPSSPRILLNTLIAGALGLVLGVGIAIAADHARQSRRSARPSREALR